MIDQVPIRLGIDGSDASIAELLRQLQRVLGIVSDVPGLEAQLLLAKVCRWPRSKLFAHPSARLTRPDIELLQSLVDRRRRGEPIAYLMGEQEFWSLPLQVGPKVLVPRADTETAVEQSLILLRGIPAPTIIDLGTGSGAIALAIAKERPDALVIGCDNSSGALEMAARNRKGLAIHNLRLVRGHWAAHLRGSCADLIVSNPPYLPCDSVFLHGPGICFEPREALVAGDDGLACLREVIDTCKRVLKPMAHLVLEHGFDQAAAVHSSFGRAGYDQVQCHLDLGGLQRISCARWPG